MNKSIRNFFHYIITGYIIFGNLFTNDCTLLQVHFYFCALVILHWFTNNNKCFLAEYDYENKNGYTLELLQSLNINIPDDDIVISTTIAYLCIIIPMLISYFKLRQFKCLKK
jgi:hypothetical protein